MANEEKLTGDISSDLETKLTTFATHFDEYGSLASKYIELYKEYLEMTEYDSTLLKEKMKSKVNEVFNG